VLVLVVVGINAVAFMQTWTMTHYAPAGTRTVRPEDLSLLDKFGVVLTGVSVPRPSNKDAPTDVGLTSVSERITVGDSDGGELGAWYVAREGASGVILMFPGYAESKDGLLHQAAELYRMGWASLLVDFRGAGDSTGDSTTLGAREARDVAAALRYARHEWPGQRYVLYGVSMGAAAILRAYAQEGAHADALILESPFDSLLSTVENRFHAMGLPSFPAAPLMVFWGSVQLGYNGFADNPISYAASVQCPVLFMYGTADPRVTAEQSAAIYAQLNPAGGKTSVAFEWLGHESLLAGDATLWDASVAQFLRTVGDNR
jgi:alpha-beta hydrolase superfamily lysophospholipase